MPRKFFSRNDSPMCVASIQTPPLGQPPAAIVEENRAADSSIGRAQKIEAARFFKNDNVRLLQRPVAQVGHDLDAGQIAFVNRAVEALPGERFLVNRAVGVAVEQTAD